MKSQDVPIKSGTIKVMMKSDSEVLQEVVVTGMQKMDKRLFTGATKQLNADNVKLDGLPDISRGLEGRAAGVSVQNVSGTFGTAPKIRVRGATSIYGSSKPLWVVDGVILEDAIDVGPDDLSSGDAETLISSAIAGLNSDDIESFQILKDGSATSIYGARAMAGVIVVTTKKGRAGVSKISYTGEFTTRAIPSYKEFNIMNSQEQMGIYKEISFVCLRLDGSLELPSTLSIVCRSVAKKLEGFEDFHFHQLRHTYTSNLLSNGAAPKDVQELLGHSDVSTTMNIYAHSTRKAKRDSARLLDKVVSNA